MFTMRTSLIRSRALVRPHAPIGRRTYAGQPTPAQKTSLSSTSGVLVGAALAVPAAFYFIQTNQSNKGKDNHDAQKRIRGSDPDAHNKSFKDMPSKSDPNDSDLPNDAPNNPANKEKVSRSVPCFALRCCALHC